MYLVGQTAAVPATAGSLLAPNQKGYVEIVLEYDVLAYGIRLGESLPQQHQATPELMHQHEGSEPLELWQVLYAQLVPMLPTLLAARHATKEQGHLHVLEQSLLAFLLCMATYP